MYQTLSILFSVVVNRQCSVTNTKQKTQHYLSSLVRQKKKRGIRNRQMLQLLEFVRLICPVGREVRERVTGAATEAESIVIFRTLTRSDYYHTNLHTVTVRSYDTKKRLLATPLGLSSLKFTLCSIMIFTLFLGRRSTNSRALNFFLPQFIDLHANLGSRFEPSLLLDSICTPPAVAERNTLTAGVATHTPKSYILVVVVVAYLLSSMNRKTWTTLSAIHNPQ